MKYINYIFKFTLLCLLLPLFYGCNEEDDIDGIFIGKTWYVTNLLKANSNNTLLEENDWNTLANNRSKYLISFSNETFHAQAGDYTFEGKWSVDGKKQAIHFIINDNIVGTDVISREFIKILKEASTYKGTYTYLRIYTEAKTSVLFHQQ